LKTEVFVLDQLQKNPNVAQQRMKKEADKIGGTCNYSKETRCIPRLPLLDGRLWPRGEGEIGRCLLLL